MNPVPGSELKARVNSKLASAGLTGSILVRDLDSGRSVGIDTDRLYPLASLAKLPLALAVLDQIAAGHLDGAGRIRVQPGRVGTPGPTGTTRFRHHADLALDDLVYLCVSLSDNAAADALFELVPPAEVSASLAAWGIGAVSIRHGFADHTRTPTETLPRSEVAFAHSMAIGEVTAGGGHRLHQLDVTSTNSGSAQGLSDLLAMIWSSGTEGPLPRPSVQARERLRELLAANVHRQRLAPDFASDSALWSSKTGTLLNLRHEAGVVEHDDGTRVSVTVLTESHVAAAIQPYAEHVMGEIARDLHDHVRA
ncbi:serine hydrolase [Subtercola boreus]|uniref:Serine hydrolase n=1 Tax=Subtercola boreus TaxID=120213 RepID=A0A3E0VBN7_9MICO|nr:serine hydrolase [Subtercola boreus]RFA07109.1 serine hydrolase [Subtercola boreus]